jgi:hypothetical protein
MCTVTIVSGHDGFRLMCNRDERTGRGTAEAPRIVRLGRVTALFPRDPDGGGTWIGVNDTGLALAMLNASTPRRVAPPPRWRSRGLIIPNLLALTTLEDVERALRDLPLFDFPPFRLVAAHRGRVHVHAWCDVVESTHARLTHPLLFTSSSLGDVQADAIRRPLFDAVVLASPDSLLAGQQRFHDISLESDPAFGVRMMRQDARTVSQCTVDAWEHGVTMRYCPIEGQARAA